MLDGMRAMLEKVAREKSRQEKNGPRFLVDPSCQSGAWGFMGWPCFFDILRASFWIQQSCWLWATFHDAPGPYPLQSLENLPGQGCPSREDPNQDQLLQHQHLYNQCTVPRYSMDEGLLPLFQGIFWAATANAESQEALLRNWRRQARHASHFNQIQYCNRYSSTTRSDQILETPNSSLHSFSRWIHSHQIGGWPPKCLFIAAPKSRLLYQHINKWMYQHINMSKCMCCVCMYVCMYVCRLGKVR